MVGFTIRIYGINFYLPLHLHLDENNIFDKAFQMIKNQDLNPHYYRYPTLLPYLQVAVYTPYLLLVKLFSFNNTKFNPELLTDNLFIIGRGISAVAGTATLYVTYLMGKKLFNQNVGLFAAAFLSLTFIHVVSSHYLVTDALMILLGTLAFYYSIGLSNYVGRDKIKRYLLVGGFIGLANATKYNPFYLVFLFEPLFLLWNKEKDRVGLFLSSFSGVCWGILGFTVVFCITNPYLLLELSNYLKGFTSQVLLFTGNEISTFSDANETPTWKWWIEYLMVSGISYTMFPLPVIGFLLIFKQGLKKIYYPLIIFPFIYCLFIFSVSHRADRYIDPVLPFFATYAALSLEFIWNQINKTFEKRRSLKVTALTLLVILVFTWPLAKIIAFDYLISQKDTRLIAAEWIEENIPKEKMVFAIAESAPIGHYLQSKGSHLNVINMHNSTFGSRNWLPFEGTTVLDYPECVVVMNMKDYYETKNYTHTEEFRKFQTDYHLLKSTATLIREVTKPLFLSGFFAPFHLLPSATTHSYHNPTVQIFEVTKLSKSPNLFTLTGEEVSGYSGAPLVIDSEVEGKKVAELSQNKAPSTSGPHLPFPAGKYRVSFRVKFDNVADGADIARLKVHHSGNPQMMHAEKTFTKSINNSNNKYTWLSADFILKNNDRLEFVLQTQVEKLWISEMKIELL